MRNSVIDRRHFVALTAASALAPAVVGGAAAQPSSQAWPNRFVRLVVPFPPGGANEPFARNLGAKLSEIWGQQVVVDNKPGAAGNLGAEFVARSAPDGYTMLIGGFPNAVNQFLYPSVGYDFVADFAPVTLIGFSPSLLVVPNSSPARTLPELVALAKASNGRLNYASSGVGTGSHLSGELFKRTAGFEMTHVPYRGGALAHTDLIAGRVDLMFNSMTSVLTAVRAGQLRGLAVTSPKREPAAPEFPTFAEAGLPGVEALVWFGFFMPARTPREIVAKVHADTVAAMADPGVRERLEGIGIVLIGMPPAEFADFIKAEVAKWGPLIKAAGISVRE